jgi:ABC-2 type transport system permease protein
MRLPAAFVRAGRDAARSGISSEHVDRDRHAILELMHLKRAAAIVLRQFYLFRGSPVRILPTFAWVAIDIVLWGFITRYLNTVSSPGFNFVPALLGAVLLWDFLVRVMQGVTTAFFEDVWSRNFLNIFASPLSIAEYLSGLVASSIATSAVGLIVMLVLATSVFGLSFFAWGVMLVSFFLVLFLFGVALGVGGCALVLRMGPAAEWLIWPIPALLSPLACVFYPLSTLPRWMQYPARLMPPSYVFEGMRRIVSGRQASGSALALSTGLALFYILLAGWFFTRIYKYVVRTGLVARYSAESLS